MHPIEFAGSQDGIDHGGLLHGIVRSGKQIIFSSRGHRSDAVSDQVVVGAEATIVNLTDQGGFNVRILDFAFDVVQDLEPVLGVSSLVGLFSRACWNLRRTWAIQAGVSGMFFQNEHKHFIRRFEDIPRTL